ncbi:hypothetical protein CANTEDRAFT_112512 [Yamadazyma tenuis ATCC 10573]|uniref:DUF1751-domain-containing protein n=1 Tax=Candida tenuis (strain ATCC 10573 / BCRC 21748 / CBS 615 / JCM 9827 / NBRC 10315 / NRRL Y-1498 / VKM Y-70) TaxID=590646 RepID=G3AZP7_CANTC|nr:DUF1751-domain-containing protein [Yamadazyma tenuis ATCC 10573]XP_006684684.1 uncharacterized protein CANTEDRAFT_112512 [Yamadazyma tenuis ATCC 10573]EGV66109.1 DUF1751-domain-containing protein [Yamadazyma tenuis ATCC 10573]EGV66110.1 hypothetical protein CANTEDRAFT_112512 [Yamadazyma tenuis ATCC 10573]
MKVPKITSILLVALSAISVLNFLLKYYTYFVLMVSSSKKTAHEVNNIAEETGEVPHPHELYVPLLTFIPTKSPVLTRPWVLVTSSLIEENFVGLTMSFFTIFYLGKYLENIWGHKDYSYFIACNVLIGNLMVYTLFYTCSWMGQLHEVPPVVVTPMAVIMGFFVAIKQRIPSHYLLFFKGNVRVKIKYLPFLLIVSSFMLSLLSEEFRISFHLSINGFIISWVYLRFFKEGSNEVQSYLLPFSLTRKRSSKKNYKVKKTEPKETPSISTNSSLHLETVPIRGDRTEQFALYTFFPAPVSLVVKAISNIVFNVLAKYNVIDAKSFSLGDSDDDDSEQLMFEDVHKLQSKLFGLSSLNGAQDVSTIAHTNSKFKSVWDWVVGGRGKKAGVNTSMDKRRKQALKEFE